MGKQAWSFSEHPKTKRWYVTIPAGTDEESLPTIEQLKAGAIERGIEANSLLSDAAIQKNLDKAADNADGDISFPIVIDPTFDVRLIIAQDKTGACLYIRKAADHRVPLDMKMISSVINSSGFKGLDAAKIKETIGTFRASPAMELNDFTIATGTPPGRGKDRELVPKAEWLPDADRDALIARISAWKARQAPTPEDGIFPLSEATHAALVEQHAIVYELTPAEQGPAGADIYGKPIPGLPGNDPFIQLAENISIGQAGFKAIVGGVLVVAQTDKGTKMRVLPFADGKATPIVSADNMTVTLILESEEGAGLPPSAEGALETLAKQGVRGKINRELIEKTIAEVLETKKSAEIVILTGKLPVPPGSARIEWAAGSPIKATAVNIAAGDRILTAETLPSGEDGSDVFGAPIKAATGIASKIPEHDDTIAEIAEGTKKILVASRAGCLTLTNDKLGISDTRTITGDIGDETGDVSFPGNLTVRGIVRKGRSVKADGALKVEGNAEASLVSSGESVMMMGGMLGAGRGTVWAKQEISMAFAENARILSGQDISISNYCFQCVVKTNGTLFMKGNPAVLLGGTIRASKGVEVYELGSSKTIRTCISFGQNYLVGDQVEVCERDLEKIKETVARIDAEMQRISTTDPNIHELRRKKLELLKKNEKLTVRIFTLKEQFETHVISRIRVENTVYPGVILESHGRYFEVREQRNHVLFIFDQATGQIVCRPIDAPQE
jgi:uncharacterized protein